MSSSSGGVGAAHPMATGGNGNASGQASSSAAGGAASSAAGTLLWTKTQQLPEEAFRQLHSIYGDHFPIEARHHLAGTVSKKIIVPLVNKHCKWGFLLVLGPSQSSAQL